MSPEMSVVQSWTVTVERPGLQWPDIRKRHVAVTFRPIRVVVQLRRDGRDGVLRWTVGAEGPRVLKDGSVSERASGQEHWRPEGGVLVDAPEWLEAVVAEALAEVAKTFTDQEG